MRDGVSFRRLYLWAFFLLLAGLMFFDKPLAYLRVGPLFISDLILVIGLAVAATRLVIRGFPDHLGSVRWPLVALIAFLGYEALLTAVDVTVWGKPALRDGAVWGYGLFALCLLVLVPREELLQWIARYRTLVPFYVLWAPVAIGLLVLRPDRLRLPGTPVSLYLFRPGSIGVHLSGAAIALLLWRFPKRVSLRYSVLLVWGFGWFLVANLSRAAILATLAGLTLAMVLSFRRAVVLLALAVGIAWLVVAASGARIIVPKRDQGAVRKEISSANLTRTFNSLWKLGERGVRQRRLVRGQRVLRARTAAWRLRWWRKIVGYTLFGPYRWTGKGFGVNLADDDGFQVRRDHGLRSPHNVFMTILARSGLPGLGLFALFLVCVVATGLASWHRNPEGSLALVWVLGYLTASVTDGSFSVAIENPMGGIWFWTLVATILLLSTRTRPDLSPRDSAVRLASPSAAEKKLA